MGTATQHDPRQENDAIPQTRGIILNWGWFYDFVMWAITGGRDQALRQLTADLAQLRPGEAVLDVGCGTGTLAIVARQRVGDAGRVCGIDPAPKQIARSRAKAARQNCPVEFKLGVIEQIDYPDQSFDVVQSTFMIDHVPADLQRQGLKEIARVLKPGGRLLIMVTGSVHELSHLMAEAGFTQIETGERRFQGIPVPQRLNFAIGKTGRTARS